MSTQEWKDEGDPKKYFAQIPNIVLKLGLSPYALTLYFHVKQTAAEDGRCNKGTSTLARETGMGAGSVSRAKEELLKPQPLLNGKPLISITDEPARAGKPRHVVTVTDIWPENMAYFASGRSTGERQKASGRSRGERQSSTGEICRSTGEIKKNVLRRTSEEDAPRAKPRSRTATISEQDFLETLKANPAYEGLNIEHVRDKLAAWCLASGKTPTRRQLVVWLNREDKPLVHGPPGSNILPMQAKETPEEKQERLKRQFYRQPA